MNDFYCETCGIDTENFKDTTTVKEYDSDFVLYSTGCPKCKVLEKKMESKNMDFVIETNIDPLIEMGFMSVPVLYNKSKNEYLNFTEAVNFVNNII